MNEKSLVQMKQQVETILDKVRANIKSDGGNIELVDIKTEGIVYVRLKGACNACPMATITLKNVVEKILKDNIPWIKEVQSV